MPDQDLSEALLGAVRAAIETRRALAILGGGSKSFLGLPCEGDPLDVRGHRGVVDYEPTELVLTARAGTPLKEVEALLEAHGQMLTFEPPDFGGAATLGGVVAAGLSGPRRPWGGAVRDAVLGIKLINGRGELLRFGGQVMKNVAGYDVSRLMAGAFGTLGVILEVSIKLQPRPAHEQTLALELPRADALRRFVAWRRNPWCVTATAHDGERGFVRLSGGDNAVASARAEIGGEPVPDGAAFWGALKNQTLPCFAGDAPLWRLSLPPAAPDLDLGGPQVCEWNGAQRWVRSDRTPVALRAIATQHGGHATLLRGALPGVEPFTPLPPAMLELHRRIKRAFDPHGLFNPGRLYPGL